MVAVGAATGSAALKACDAKCGIPTLAAESSARSGLSIWQTTQLVTQVSRLGATDFEIRAKAVQAIIRMGLNAVPRLSVLLTTEKDLEIKLQIQFVISELSRRNVFRPERECLLCGKG